jgi:UDP-N-acetylglucosamine diphosphorylase/glucosamine-1-phosphate N-acetyltransferase
MLEDLKKRKLATIILAAGKGTRMHSDLAKVLHLLGGRPMLSYPVALAREIGSQIIIIITGHQSDSIRKTIKGGDLVFVEQKEQLGTGHAVLQASETLQNFVGDILILCGDVPLLMPSTVNALLESHLLCHASVTVLTTILSDPTGYGRVVKGKGNAVLKIIEERDANEEEKRIREINSGIYCVDSSFLFESVGQIDNNNAQGEYYLTDILEIAGRTGCKTNSFVAHNRVEVMGINTREHLEIADRIIKK